MSEEMITISLKEFHYLNAMDDERRKRQGKIRDDNELLREALLALERGKLHVVKDHIERILDNALKVTW